MARKNLYLFQPQYTMNFQGTTQNWLPYSAGCLWAYANEKSDIVKEHWNLDGLYFARDKIDEVLEKMEEPVLAGFSTYVWNEQYNLHMAYAIKERWPNCIIAFGGPQVNESDLDTYPWIDLVMLSEGEKQFTMLLEDIHNNKPLKTIYTGQRITDLSELPSPFTTGVFDKLIADNPDIIWQTPFETSRGCPFSCTFCDWGSLTYSKVKQYEFERLEEEIIWMSKNPIAYVFMADANFGIFKKRDVDLAKMFHKHLDNSRMDKINIQYAKNSNDHVIEIGKALGRLGKGITLSQQSMSPTVLEEIKRTNMDINKLNEMLDKTEEADLDAYSEMIIGLPGETLESWKKGMGEILEAGQHNCVEVWYAQTLKNSDMSTIESREKYGIKTVLVKDYIFLYNDPDDIPEYVEVVSGTKDMPTEDMIEAYMYSWMVVRFHVYGYTYALARYARQKGISYNDFYEKMFSLIPSTNHIDDHFNTIKRSVSKYLTEDQVGEDAGKGWFQLRKNIPDHRQKPASGEAVADGRLLIANEKGGDWSQLIATDKTSPLELTPNGKEEEERPIFSMNFYEKSKGNSNMENVTTADRYEKEEEPKAMFSGKNNLMTTGTPKETMQEARVKVSTCDEETKNDSAHAWLYQKETDFVDHKLEIYDIAWQTLKHFLPDTDESILDCQKAYMFDPSHVYPFTLRTKMDWNTFEETEEYKYYTVTSNMTEAGGTYDNRRNRHPAKNTLTLIENEDTHVEETKLARAQRIF